ncbi:MAG: hypothetical protein ACRD9R_15640 [Pyrinomonadaceae bacterium]
MNTPRRLAASALALSAAALLFLPSSFLPANNLHASAAVQQLGALERGYRTGYSDGYQAGYRDSVGQAGRDFRRHEEYQRGERAYIEAYGALEIYRDGYQQGFEIGYDAGYDRRGFDSAVPAGLTRRGPVGDDSSSSSNTGGPASGVTSDSPARDGDTIGADLGGTVLIPQDTTMRVELLTSLSTDATQRGDRFDARVLDPREFEGATVSGRITRVRRPGKVKGSGELQLTFEQIRLPDGRFSNFNAQVIEVVQRRDGAGEADEEGGVRGRDTTKDDVTKVGAGAGIGAIIGAIAGGGKGAAIGAAIGAGVGTGGVLASRGKDIRLERGEELLIRTATNTQVQ